MNGVLVDSIVKMGHHSVLEHVNITFAIDKISRACSHQLVRHRIASYSQQSQRYVKYDKIDYVVPASIKEGTIMEENFREFMEHVNLFYKFLVEHSIPEEDARFALPNACCTNITMTVNARELIEMCKVRLCSTSQWEIKKLFNMIRTCISAHKELNFIEPYLMAKCDWIKFCPEGKRSCGKHQTAKDGD